jgi:hypothetical protein
MIYSQELPEVSDLQLAHKANLITMELEYLPVHYNLQEF